MLAVAAVTSPSTPALLANARTIGLTDGSIIHHTGTVLRAIRGEIASETDTSVRIAHAVVRFPGVAANTCTITTRAKITRAPVTLAFQLVGRVSNANAMSRA